MGMSTFVTGFKPPDEKWKKMKAVWDACEKANLDPPKEVNEFFGYDKPDDNGVKIDGDELLKSGAVRYVDNHHPEAGYEIDTKKLAEHHPDVTIVRVENAW